MVRKAFVAGLSLLALVGAGCSSDSGSSATSFPTTARKNWTTAGLAQAHATADALARAIPGQCTDAADNDFTRFPLSMKQFNSPVVPTGQLLCTINDETVEISAFANAKDRDRYVDDRSTGICARAAEMAKKDKKPFLISGLRWVSGAGNITVQPDSEGLARQIAGITKGRYVPRSCTKLVTMDWNGEAVKTVNAVAAKIATAGEGCDSVTVLGRDTLVKTRTITAAQLPAAVAQCTVNGGTVQLIAWTQPTKAVRALVKSRSAASCSADPALGRIDGAGWVILAGGTRAERVAQLSGGKLSSACGSS